MSHSSRRQFLKQASAGALLASTSIPYATAASSSKKLGVALVGLGYYSGDLLAPALQLTEFSELRGIVTGSPEKIPVWQKRYGIKDSNVYNYDNMHELANNPDIDIVYVVVPTALHLKYAEIAANAGKHVWCEKPMALTAKQCQTMIDVCAKNKVQLTVGYRMQHEPNTRAFGKYHVTQPFGAIKNVISQSGYGGNGAAADYWRMQKHMGGGAMYDMGVYALNGARFITGKEPIAVSAYHEKSHPAFTEVDETTYFTLEFADGLRAECATSVVKSFNQLQVNCAKGWYKLAPMQSYTGVTGSTSGGQHLPAFAGNQQARQMDNDALAVLGKGPILVPGEEGMKDIRIVEAIFKSAANNRQRITLV
ncbi:Gfo/Idh/MocA family oxidoreductase [Alteromonadaceae bacterium BrNp21-10]|nr:Gfo/Idh/MocA family oxidoreductase [Alteromonadaceae bacterium BrNp21-10]